MPDKFDPEVLLGAAAQLVAGFLIALLVTPLVQRLAWRLNITDRPDGHRKLHDKPIPLGGGVSVFCGLWGALLLGCFIKSPWSELMLGQLQDRFTLAAASLLILIVGLVDDRVSLRGRQKLLGQFAAAAILVAGGLRIGTFGVFDFHVELGIASIPFTLFWMVGAMNSLNLLDGTDGLASTVGVILSATISGLAMLCGHPGEALVIAGLAGSLLGFLRYNFPPAKIYLGDAGSMLIGLVVGAMAIRSTLKGPATVALAAPLTVWAIPILDSTAAVLRRKLTGRSIYATDRGHLHHRLLARSGSAQRTLAWIGLACAATSVGALASVFLRSDLFAVLSAFSVVSILVATKVFGHVELLLLSSRLKNVGLSFLSRSGPERAYAQEASVRLQGTRPWDQLWASLVEFTSRFDLLTMRLDVNVPAFHEGYHASWKSPKRTEAVDRWTIELPLTSGTQIVGRLAITGRRGDSQSSCEIIARLMDLLYPFEARLQEMAASPGTQSVFPLITPSGRTMDDSGDGPIDLMATAAAIGHPTEAASRLPVAPR